MKRIENKVAIVTGGAGGIGRVVAEVFAAEGAAVAIADLNEAGARGVAEGIEASGGRAMAIGVDVSDEAAVAGMVAAVVETYGGLDILHNNAALTSPAVLARDGMVVDADVEVWDRMFAVNLRGYLLGCKYAVPEMIRRGGGSIINTSSQRSRWGDLNLTAMGVSKAAIDALTKYVATQYGKQGVRCNSLVITGIVHGPNYEAIVSEEAQAIRTRHVLTSRLGTPHDVANAALFIATDESAYITGHLLAVDGGWSAHTPRYADELPHLSG
jgi:NAD(P)-dependent dehydrogenase (short-subunit alcohol dehydrogenase family)